MAERIPEDQVSAILSETALGQSFTAQQAASTEAATRAVELEDASVAEGLGAAVQEWDTTKLIQAWDRSAAEDRAYFDPNFDPQAEYKNIRELYNLPDTPDVRERLGRAINTDEMSEWATELRESYDRKELMESNLGYTLVNWADPGALLVDALAFGSGKALRLGRVGAGALGASGNLAYLGVVDSTARDVSAIEYAATGLLSGGAHALFGGEVANKIARGEAHWFGGLSRTPEAPETIPEGAQAGAGVAGALAGARRATNEFLSEYDFIVPDEAAKDVVGDLLDDPVRRDVQNGNGASVLRRNRNEAEGWQVEYEQELTRIVRQQHGIPWSDTIADVGGRFTAARDTIEAEVAEEMLRRQSEALRFGADQVSPGNAPEHIKKLADAYAKLMDNGGQMMQRQGVPGFEDFATMPGYFHRSWLPEVFLQVEQKFMRAVEGVADVVRNGKKVPAATIARERARDFTRELFVESLRKGANLTRAEARPIATAILTRMDAKRANQRVDFLGSLGKADSEAIREMLVDAGTDESTIKSVMTRLEAKQAEAGKLKYSKSRLPLDMTVSIEVPVREGAQEFVTLRMSDFIDKGLSRLADNYLQAAAGRSALAAAGYGGDDASLQALRKRYAQALEGRPQSDVDARLLQLDRVLGDFTGIRPEQDLLSQTAQRAKSFAGSTMLGASGLWQITEYARMAQQYGVVQTTKELFRAFPSLKTTLQNASPDLKDELKTVLGLDLARDVRIHPWLRQHEAFLSSADTAFDRVLHAGKQLTPFLNGMKYIHAHQVRMNTNLALNKLVRAANGDESAKKMYAAYGLKGAEFDKVAAAVRRNCDTQGKNVTSMNWGAWLDDEVDSAMNAVLRVMDDTVLYGRSGQGATFARSGVGQVLGQFTQFVSFAHNKLLRGTLHDKGMLGLAGLLAFQYPLTMLVVYANEARKGNLDETDLQDVAQKAVGYTSGLGFFADAAGILGITGHQSGRSVPALGMFNLPGQFAGGVANIATGDVAQGSWDIAKTMSQMVPGLSAMPATALLLESIKPE